MSWIPVLTIQEQQQQHLHQQQVQIQQQPTTPQKRTITITAQNPQNNNLITVTPVPRILQQQQQQQKITQTTLIVAGSTQQPKCAQVEGKTPNVKGKTTSPTRRIFPTCSTQKALSCKRWIPPETPSINKRYRSGRRHHHHWSLW